MHIYLFTLNPFFSTAWTAASKLGYFESIRATLALINILDNEKQAMAPANALK